VGKRIAMIAGGDDAAKFAWECLAQTLCYAANRHIDAVTTDLVQVDNAMKWGFAQDLGPFETWDAIGVAESVERMLADGFEVPTWVQSMLASGRTRFYEGPLGARSFWHHEKLDAAPEVLSPRFRHLPAPATTPRW
jgi:3-hydroxyacyl-CoA dehydrogenase